MEREKRRNLIELYRKLNENDKLFVNRVIMKIWTGTLNKKPTITK